MRGILFGCVCKASPCNVEAKTLSHRHESIHAFFLRSLQVLHKTVDSACSHSQGKNLKRKVKSQGVYNRVSAYFDIIRTIKRVRI
jgi:hypothetical protein